MKIGDKIDYVFYKNVEIAGEDDRHYVLKLSSGVIKKVYKELVEKYGKIKMSKEIKKEEVMDHRYTTDSNGFPILNLYCECGTFVSEMRTLRTFSQWFLDKDDSSKPMCAFKEEEHCTPNCIACVINKDDSGSKATCLRGDFVFANIIYAGSEEDK